MVVLAVVYASSRDDHVTAPTLPGTPLRELGGDRRIGTAVRVDVLQDVLAYRQDVAGQFSAVTPENELKWGFMERERGKVDYGPADTLLRRAGQYGQDVRGHTLVWHFQMPGWAEQLKGTRLRDAMRLRIRDVMGRYRDRIRTWDVVNEAITDRGGLRRSPFERELGPGYIADAFRTAHTADPKARLYINEIGADGLNAKSDRLFELVSDLRRQGVPIDGVGFQAHFALDSGAPDGFRRNLERFAALGVEVAITEADVALPTEPGARDLRRQAEVYAEIVGACRAVPACRSLTFWGFTDAYSWISETQAGFGSATLLDSELRPKPAFRAVQRALKG